MAYNGGEFIMKKVIVLCSILFLMGCSMLPVSKAVLLPEDRIFTLAAGQTVSLLLDGKAMEITFPHDMKLVSASFLVQQEIENNKSFFAKVKAEKNKTKAVGVATGVLGALGGAFAAMKKKKTSVKV